MARIVIMGGGPAGYEAALVAAQHGSDVTVVEQAGMGGACVLDAYEGGLPSARYLGVIADAAEQAGAPDDYVRALRNHPCRRFP